MVGRMGVRADILITESVLGRILETVDSMLLDSPNAGVMLTGRSLEDDNGSYVVIEGLGDSEGLGICVASSEGGTDPTDEEISLLKNRMKAGILMKADVFAHQFSFYKVGDEVSDATVLFVE